jgi:toxin ParE1/3/4
VQNIIIRPEAENDINSAFDWYEEQRSGLGDEFALELMESMDRIIDTPQLYSDLYCGIRRALLRKFPFGIYYLLNEGNITVLSVLHLAMDPVKWKKRL